MFETGTLERGDSVNFESGTPHRLSNPYDEECVAIWVVVRPGLPTWEMSFMQGLGGI